MPPRLSIPAQVSLGFYAAIGAILLIGGASLISLQEVREAAIEVERNRRIMADTEALVSELMDAETEGRGFVITGTQRRGPAHLDAVVRVSAILPRLHGLVRDPRARASLMAVERRAWERLEMVERLDAELPPEPLLADCDKDRIAQVLANFVSNALKFTPRGRIRLAAARDPAGTKVLVADEGIGISPEGRGRLFRTFAQLEAGRVAGGTGLGLALAKKIVESHGGSIGVDSEVGRGSTFFFVLPAALGGHDGQKDPGRGRRGRHPAADGDPAPEGRP